MTSTRPNVDSGFTGLTSKRTNVFAVPYGFTGPDPHGGGSRSSPALIPFSIPTPNYSYLQPSTVMYTQKLGPLISTPSLLECHRMTPDGASCHQLSPVDTQTAGTRRNRRALHLSISEY